MKRQLSLKDKLRVFWLWMRHSTESLICVCEYCRSTKIKRINPHTTEHEEDGRVYKRYRTNYQCLNCGALARASETWSDNHLKEGTNVPKEETNDESK